MAYKKPQIIAKSAAKQVFVAGCPTNKPSAICAAHGTQPCMCGPAR